MHRANGGGRLPLLTGAVTGAGLLFLLEFDSPLPGILAAVAGLLLCAAGRSPRVVIPVVAATAAGNGRTGAPSRTLRPCFRQSLSSHASLRPTSAGISSAGGSADRRSGRASAPERPGRAREAAGFSRAASGRCSGRPGSPRLMPSRRQSWSRSAHRPETWPNPPSSAGRASRTAAGSFPVTAVSWTAATGWSGRAASCSR